ncbi:hypothetical protein KKH39_01960 [Patescibacteria group bacterium]|nr:hypothetical protein [Patescibacteria group bacterium]
MKKIKKLPTKVIKHLEKAGIKHDMLEHRTVYTAIDAAATMRKKVDEVAKALLVKADKDYYVVILPADHNLDIVKLQKVISKASGRPIKVVKIPGETLAREVLKIKNNAMAAFGSLYKLPVLMESKLTKTKKAIFSSESYNHSVEMAVKDFVKLENALVASFGAKRKIKKVPAPKKKVVKKKITKKKLVKKAVKKRK